MNNYNYLDTSHNTQHSTLPIAPPNTLFNLNTYMGPQTTATRGGGGSSAAHVAALTALRSLNTTTSTLPSSNTANYAYDPSDIPQQFLAPPPGVTGGGWNTQPTMPGMNTQYNPPNLKQNDGANDEVDSERLKIDAILLKKFARVQKQQQLLNKMKNTPTTTTTKIDTPSSFLTSLSSSPSSIRIPQFDGLGDRKGQDDDDDGDDDDGSTKGDEELGSDLDDDDDDEEPDTEHIVLCQYEKVTRVKNKRKANLKDGIMHINGKDYVFSKATGEFDW